MPRPAHQQRVIDERAELEDKIEKLGGFIISVAFEGVPRAEQGRLRSQLVHMRDYAADLVARVEADFT